MGTALPSAVVPAAGATPPSERDGVAGEREPFDYFKLEYDQSVKVVRTGDPYSFGRWADTSRVMSGMSGASVMCTNASLVS